MEGGRRGDVEQELQLQRQQRKQEWGHEKKEEEVIVQEGGKEKERLCVRDWTIRRSGEEHRKEWVCEIDYRKKERGRIKHRDKKQN